MKNRVTVVPEDRLISVDGDMLQFAFSLPEGFEHLHALQWYGQEGELEFTDDMNQKIQGQELYNSDVLPFVQMWEAEKARLDAEAAKPVDISVYVDQKKREGMRAYDVASQNLVKYYTTYEISTFYKQEKEAVAWYEATQSGTVYTTEQLITLYPFTYALSVSRGEAIDILVGKILKKAATVAMPNGALLGAKQTVEHMADAAQSVEDITAIDVRVVFNERVAPYGFEFDIDYNILPFTTG